MYIVHCVYDMNRFPVLRCRWPSYNNSSWSVVQSDSACCRTLVRCRRQDFQELSVVAFNFIVCSLWHVQEDARRVCWKDQCSGARSDWSGVAERITHLCHWYLKITLNVVRIICGIDAMMLNCIINECNYYECKSWYFCCCIIYYQFTLNIELLENQ